MSRRLRVGGGLVALGLVLAIVLSIAGAQPHSTPTRPTAVKPSLYLREYGRAAPSVFVLPPEPQVATGCTKPSAAQCGAASFWKTHACASAPATDPKRKSIDAYCTWLFQKDWVGTAAPQRATLIPTSAPSSPHPLLSPARPSARGKNVEAKITPRMQATRGSVGAAAKAGTAKQRVQVKAPSTASLSPRTAKSSGGSFAALAAESIVPAAAAIRDQSAGLRGMRATTQATVQQATAITSIVLANPPFVSSGPSVNSCQEYAYKRWGDWSRFAFAAHRLDGNHRAIYELGMDPSSPLFINKKIEQFATSTPTPTQIPEALRRYAGGVAQDGIPLNAFYAQEPTWLDNVNVGPMQRTAITNAYARAKREGSRVKPAGDGTPLGMHKAAKHALDTRWGNPLDEELEDITKRTGSYLDLLARRTTLIEEAHCAQASDPCFRCRPRPDPSAGSGAVALHPGMQKVLDRAKGWPVVNPADVAVRWQTGTPTARAEALATMSRISDAVRDLDASLGRNNVQRRAPAPTPATPATPRPGPTQQRPTPTQPDSTKGRVTPTQPGPAQPGGRLKPQPTNTPQPRPKLRRGPSSSNATPLVPLSGGVLAGPTAPTPTPGTPQSGAPQSCLSGLIAARPTIDAALLDTEQQLTDHLVNELQFGNRGCLKDPGSNQTNICDWSYELFAGVTRGLFDQDVERDFQDCQTKIGNNVRAGSVAIAGNAFPTITKNLDRQVLLYPCVKRRDFSASAPVAGELFEMLDAPYGRECEALRQTRAIEDVQSSYAKYFADMKWSPLSAKVEDYQSNTMTIGEPDILGAYFRYDAGWQLERTKVANNDELKGCEFQGSGRSRTSAGLHFFSKNIELFNSDGEVKARTSPGHVRHSAYIRDIENWDKIPVGGIDRQLLPAEAYIANAPVLLLGGDEFEFYTTIGPFNIRIMFGFGAVAGVVFWGEANRGNNCADLSKPTKFALRVGAVPFASATAFADAALDYGVASAGVRLDLTLLDARFPIGLDISNRGSDWQFKNGGAIAIEMLSGKLTGYVEAGVAPLEVSFSAVIHEWDGFRERFPAWGLDRQVPAKAVRALLAKGVLTSAASCKCDTGFCCSDRDLDPNKQNGLCPSKLCPPVESRLIGTTNYLCRFSSADAKRLNARCDNPLYTKEPKTVVRK